jgi:parallel beta-helix repeat protein
MNRLIIVILVSVIFNSFGFFSVARGTQTSITQADDSEELQGLFNSKNQLINLATNRTYTVSKQLTIDHPLTIAGNNCSIIFKGNIDTGLLINSDNISILNMSLTGDNTTNIIKLSSGAKNISINKLNLTGAKVGIESSNDHANINISNCQFNVSVHGVVLRGTRGAVVKNNIFSGKRTGGGTGVYILGSSLTASAISNGIIFLNENRYKVGDVVRFYGNEKSSEIENDLNYYVRSSSQKTITISRTLGGKALNLSQNSQVKCLALSKNVQIINNTTSNNQCGIYLIRTDSSTVSGNFVEDITGIQLEESWNNQVSRNKVKDAKDLGINLHKNSSYNEVFDNSVTNCGNAALGLTGDITSKIANNNYNVLVNNDLSNSKALSSYPSLTGNGIELNQLGKGNVIRNNRIYGNQNYGIRIAKGIHNTVVFGNTVTSNKFGVNISNDGTDLDSNEISKNYNDGIIIGENVSDVKIKRNKLSKNGSYAIKGGAKSRMTKIYNNIMDENNIDSIDSNGIKINKDIENKVKKKVN